MIWVSCEVVSDRSKKERKEGEVEIHAEVTSYA